MEINEPSWENHKSGLVPVIGRPNVGKSTLVNSLTGQKISIVTPKAQTTRRRIMGIVNGPDYQIIFTDTPGMLDPAYELHRRMIRQIEYALKEADVLLLVTDPREQPDMWNDPPMPEYLKLLKRPKAPMVVFINKSDLATKDQLENLKTQWAEWVKEHFTDGDVLYGSALKGENLDQLVETIVRFLPPGPPLFPKDQTTDITERLLAAEIIREKIFLNFRQEVPYATEVQIVDWQDKEHVIVISAEIIVERDSQKKILIGRQGQAIKKIGIQARQELEQLLGKKVFLELRVKVRPDWRERNDYLKMLGYE